MNFDKIVIILAAATVTLLCLSMELTTYENVSIFLFVYYLLSLINSVGKSFDLLLIPVVLLIFECLIMPSVVYNVYNDDPIIIALKYNMAVNKERYYSFVFWGTLAMIVGMRVKILNSSELQKKISLAVSKSKDYLSGKGNLGILLIIIGAASGVLEIITPGELKYVLYLFGKLIIVGTIYIYYSEHKSRTIYLTGALLFIILQSLAAGLFGDLIYTLLLGGLLITLSFKVKIYHKLLFAVTGFILILLIQNVKADYRKLTWGESKGKVAETDAFLGLVSDRIVSANQYFDPALMFPTVNRFNQGMIVAKVIDYVPKTAPFADGETIYGSIAATFVPRILWPDKPKAGGYYNMIRFTGFEIIGYSMNVGVIGEAYANFGVNGGIAFMLLFGLFFNFIFYQIVKISVKRPTVILWIPFVYLNAVQAETDTLMTINSTIKNLIFVFFCYWAANRFLRLKL